MAHDILVSVNLFSLNRLLQIQPSKLHVDMAVASSLEDLKYNYDASAASRDWSMFPGHRGRSAGTTLTAGTVREGT